MNKHNKIILLKIIEFYQINDKTLLFFYKIKYLIGNEILINFNVKI